VICDYNLKSDRYTGIDILRSASNTKTKPVTILHTNHIFAKNVNDQFGDVVQMLMPKPMGQEELQAVIRLAVSQRYATAGASQVALIEDDDIFVENFEHSVKAYAIHTYRTPDEFIKATQSTPLSNYEAVITDYYFTGTQMTGSDVAEFVLRTGQGTVPVLLYSDRNRVDSRFFQGHINKSSAEIETEIRESIQRFKADKDTLK